MSAEAMTIDLSPGDYAWGEVVPPGTVRKVVSAVVKPIKSLFSWMFRGVRKVVQTVSRSMFWTQVTSTVVTIVTCIFAFKAACFAVAAIPASWVVVKIIAALVVWYVLWSVMCYIFAACWLYCIQ